MTIPETRQPKYQLLFSRNYTVLVFIEITMYRTLLVWLSGYHYV